MDGGGAAVPAVAGLGEAEQAATDQGGVGQRQPELDHQPAAFDAPAQLVVLVGPGGGALDHPPAAHLDRGWQPRSGDLTGMRVRPEFVGRAGSAKVLGSGVGAGYGRRHSRAGLAGKASLGRRGARGLGGGLRCLSSLSTSSSAVLPSRRWLTVRPIRRSTRRGRSVSMPTRCSRRWRCAPAPAMCWWSSRPRVGWIYVLYARRWATVMPDWPPRMSSAADRKS